MSKMCDVVFRKIPFAFFLYHYFLYLFLYLTLHNLQEEHHIENSADQIFPKIVWGRIARHVKRQNSGGENTWESHCIGEINRMEL